MILVGEGLACNRSLGAQTDTCLCLLSRETIHLVSSFSTVVRTSKDASVQVDQRVLFFARK